MKFIVDGVEKELTVKDKNGIEWTADWMDAGSRDYIKYNENGTVSIDKENFEWWESRKKEMDEFVKYCEGNGLEEGKLRDNSAYSVEDMETFYVGLLGEAKDLVSEREKAKKEAAEGGSPEIGKGVWLKNGATVLNDTEAYRSEMNTDKINDDYSVGDVVNDQLYITTDSGNMYAADDYEITDILYSRSWK